MRVPTYTWPTYTWPTYTYTDLLTHNESSKLRLADAATLLPVDRFYDVACADMCSQGTDHGMTSHGITWHHMASHGTTWHHITSGADTGVGRKSQARHACEYSQEEKANRHFEEREANGYS